MPFNSSNYAQTVLFLLGKNKLLRRKYEEIITTTGREI